MPGNGTRLRKRIFLNLDGTGVAEFTAQGETGDDGRITSPGISNVARIGRATLLEDEDAGFEQIVYYQLGVGADEETTSLAQGIRGVGLISNVRSAYGFLCNNYDFGDEIYITGFSRGAFTARSVAGLIGRIGILTKRGLDKFYEAFEYYQKVQDGNVTRPAIDTRETDPNTGKKIMIRAVGVWDTVGALASSSTYTAWRFHDTSLGDHIEHAFHAISLNEHRGYFDVQLWENPKKPGRMERTLQNFEQCWFAGDHSNVGGSWPEQQLADISLAWMMSRLEGLGVKFDQTYLYGEFRKFQNYVREKGPKQPYPYLPELSPRQWGEGRSRDINADPVKGWVMGQKIDRRIGKMIRQEWRRSDRAGLLTWMNPIGYEGDFTVDSNEYLEDTHETVHPVIRYRHACKNHAKLGHSERGEYNPASMSSWTFPKTQTDGRLGIGGPASESNPLRYQYQRSKVPQTGKNMEPQTLPETEMGRYEKIYLAFYDQDKDLRQRDGSIWKLVLGGEGPPQEIKTAVSQAKGSGGDDVIVPSNITGAMRW